VLSDQFWAIPAQNLPHKFLSILVFRVFFWYWPFITEFYVCKSFVQQTNWEKNTQNQKVGWATIKSVRIEAGRPKIIRYKTNYLDSEYKEFPILS
jgi:hypothetical protein